MAEMDGEREVMIAPRLMQNENKSRAAAYLRDVAKKMTNLYNGGLVDEAEALLEQASVNVREAQLAEKFGEEVTL